MEFFKLAIFATLVGFHTPSFAEELIDSSAYIKNSKQPHEMRILNSGIASLYARIDMIRRAKKTIELEVFIFNPDRSGRLILQELVAAAKRGVRVRILVDKASINFKLNEYYAQALRKFNVDIRYYNDASDFKIGTIQYRNHRKLMVIDDKEALAGGRNIADEYFDLSKVLNFLDRDATISGEIVKPMRESFDRFWDSPMVQKAQPPKTPAMSIVFLPKHQLQEDALFTKGSRLNQSRLMAAEKALLPDTKDAKILNYVLGYGKHVFLKSDKHICPDITFATDREGAGVLANFSENYERNYRHLSKAIVNWINTGVKKELTIDTPYFLRNKINELLGFNLETKNININVFTNSLASTDAIHVASVFNDTINKFMQNAKFRTYTYKGKYSNETELYSPEIKKATWGTHSKSMVLDDNSFMIGTINMDNRSINFNTELGVFCTGSKELTADVLNNIKLRISKSYHLNQDGIPDDCSGLGDVDLIKRSLYYLLKIPSKWLEFFL